MSKDIYHDMFSEPIDRIFIENHQLALVPSHGKATSIVYNELDRISHR